MTKEYQFLPLFEDFIKDTLRGKRRKANGERIKSQTVVNYQQVFKLLEQFCQTRGQDIRVRVVNKKSQREMRLELNYWKRFYKQFSLYLFKERKCYDNYAGLVFKTLRTFFNYLKKERLIDCGDFHKEFFVRNEEIPVITLLPHQVKFLIQDKAFEGSLPRHLAETKDLFVFGCTVALRYSDLVNIRFRDIENVSGSYYLCVKTIKTETVVRVKLPDYARDIILKRKNRKASNSKIFRKLATPQINGNIRKIVELAGWTHSTSKRRKQDGEYRNIKSENGLKVGRDTYVSVPTQYQMQAVPYNTSLRFLYSGL